MVLTMRVETIVALAVLLLLLLQIPRVDDPPDLRLVGSEILTTEDVKGAALYLETEADGVVLMYVSELRMHADRSGVAYVTRLDGVRYNANGAPERFLADATAQAAANGWTPVSRLDDLVSPGKTDGHAGFEFRRLRLRKAIQEGRDVLFVVGRLEGRDLLTGRVVSEEYDAATCPAVPYLEAVDAKDVTGTPGRLWALTGTLCSESGSKLSRAALPVWSAGYRVVN